MFSPVKKVLIQAARCKYLQGWPEFTQAVIHKHIDVEEATVKGHLNQARQGIISTQVEEPESKQEPDNQKTNFVFATFSNMGGMIYTNQTGQFPRVCSQGYRYVMVAYIYDSNYIAAVPLKNRTEGEFQKAYETIYEICTKK
eukprot:15213254-Ditylum_brightwellii.AAC.1